MSSEQISEPGRPLVGGQGLKNAFRRIFDGQIPNFGAYNLVFADRYPDDSDGEDDTADDTASTSEGFVLGYRWRPAEIMVAPVDIAGVTGSGMPVEINMTNLVHAVQWDDGTYEVGTSTGRFFRFGVRAEPVLDVGPGTLLALAQDEDLPDVTAFLAAFVAMA